MRLPRRAAGNDRRLGLVLVAIGLAGVAAAQLASPAAGPPLYDGVVVVEPYRWLHPPAGGAGDPRPATSTLRLDGGQSPVAAVATPEQPPQAQIFGAPGSLKLPPGTTSILVSIAPVEAPAAAPPDGHVAGNVYRISVTNQAGTAITALEAAQVTVVLRGPAGLVGAAIERWTGGAWVKLKTDDAGLAATFLAPVVDFGDFALVAPGAAGSGASAAPAGSSSPGPGGSAGASPGEPSAASPPGPQPASAADSGISPLLLVAAIGVVVAVGLALVEVVLRRRARRARDRRRLRDRAGPGDRRR